MALANLSIYYTWKTLNLNMAIIDLRYIPQPGTMNLIYPMDLILFLICKIILSISSKNTKLLQITIADRF